MSEKIERLLEESPVTEAVPGLGNLERKWKDAKSSIPRAKKTLDHLQGALEAAWEITKSGPHGNYKPYKDFEQVVNQIVAASAKLDQSFDLIDAMGRRKKAKSGRA